MVHDFGGPIALPLARDPARRVRRLVVLNSWMWPADDDPHLARAGRLLGGRLGRFLYRWLNASLRVLLPAAYGDRKKLTRELHARHLAPFRDRDARVHVLWTSHARCSRRAITTPRCATPPRRSRGCRCNRLGHDGSRFRPAQLERWRRLVPHAEVTRLERAGHWPQEEDPEAIVRVLRAALR